MTFFNFLSRKKTSAISSNTSTTENVPTEFLETGNVGEDVETTAPNENKPTNDKDTKQNGSTAIWTAAVRRLRDENFYGLGKHDGYNYHSKEALDKGKQQIENRLRNALRDDIDRLKKDKIRLRIRQAEVMSFSVLEEQKIDIRIETISDDIEKFTLEMKELDENKGIIQELQSSYAFGFEKGMIEYDYDNLNGLGLNL